MLARLALRNVRRSLGDFAIYVVTLVLGVSVFYVFNAVGDQAATLTSTNAGHTASLVGDALAAVSLFVTVVLALLVVYANRFLMRRRKREFALYLLLGMSKREVSTILFLETLLIGAGSLVVGLVVGIACSQLMGGLVSGLFGAGAAGVGVTVSKGAIMKTIVHFVLMFTVVAILSRRTVTHARLIDLMQARVRSEPARLKNPVLCVPVLLVGMALLALSYYMVGWLQAQITGPALAIYICIGCLGTLLVFWGASGLFLRASRAMGEGYWKGLTCFTFRQIASRVTTVVFSMSVVCLLLFFSICMLSAGFALRWSLGATTDEYCPADVELRTYGVEAPSDDVVARYAACGFDATAGLADYVSFPAYADPGMRFVTEAGEEVYSDLEEVMRLSDYNALRTLYGREPLTLGAGEYAVVCDFPGRVDEYDALLHGRPTLVVLGHALSVGSDATVDGFVDLSDGQTNTGIVVVPDEVTDGAQPMCDYLIGIYAATDGEGRRQTEERFRAEYAEVVRQMDDEVEAGTLSQGSNLALITRDALLAGSAAHGALMTFVGLYLGLVFLVCCGAVLALRGLTESVDSAGRYEVLRKIGADEHDIDVSLLHQTAFFFLVPLALALVHTVFGMRFLMSMLVPAGIGGMIGSFALTTLVVLLVYGAYFACTYLGSRRIVSGD